jgi:hypothetical protein
MKVGDLVKMKYMMFWVLKGSRQEYTEEVSMVIGKHKNAIKIMKPDGTIKSALTEQFEVVSEASP